jgi:hypothetical protein
MKQMIQKTTHFGLILFLLAGLLAGALSLSSTQTAQAADVNFAYTATGWTVSHSPCYTDEFGGETPPSDLISLVNPSDATISTGDSVTVQFDFNPALYVHSSAATYLSVAIRMTDPNYNTFGGYPTAAPTFSFTGTNIQSATATFAGSDNYQSNPYWPTIDYQVSGVPGVLIPDPTQDAVINSMSVTFTAPGGGDSNPDFSNTTFIARADVYATSSCPDPGPVLATTPSNTPPTADTGGSYSGDEGSAIAMSGATATDPDGDSLTYTWSVDDTTLCSFDDASALIPNLTCSDNGNYTATLSVSDGVNPAVTSEASVTVNDVAPTLGAISMDADLVSVNFAITARATFTDPGALDTHTATWIWGDGTSAGTVTESAGSGSVSDSHIYSVAGVYAIDLTVTDKDGVASNQSIYQYLVVYDPSAGFVTGGGWIDSPAGAYTPDPSLSGKATFGFVSKYKKGANVPSGNTEFQFKAGDFNFHSDTYDWLVVNQGGANAQFKGSGTVNGALDDNGNAYKFMLWAGDGSPDTFRIKIWSEDASGVETVVYDNGFDQAIGGGSIVVHKGK